MLKYFRYIAKQYGKEAAEDSVSEEGTVRALGRDRLWATSVRPGMTGTGAPVTEQIEMLSLQ